MTFTANIHGATISIESTESGLLAFAREYFRGFPETSEARIHCTIIFAKNYSLRLRDRHENKPHTLGSGISWQDATHTLAIQEREWSYTVTETNGTKHATLTFRKNLWRHLIHVLTLGARETRRRYYRAAIRILPQMLVFQALENKGIWIHSGAAIAHRDAAYVFAGLPGSGKSTLAHTLRSELGAHILTENFVLTDGEKVFPFPEGNPLRSLAPVVISHVYALTHGDNFSVRDISAEEMSSISAMIDTLTAELPEHAKLAAGALISPQKTLAPKAYTAPAHLLVTDTGLANAKTYFSSL